MPPPHEPSRPAAAAALAMLLPLSLGAVALVVASRRGPPVGFDLGTFVVPALLAALYRPWGGGTIGLGALMLPVLAARGELATAGWVAALAVLAAELLDRPLWLATGGGADRRQHPRRLASAGAAATAAVAGAAAWIAVAQGTAGGGAALEGPGLPWLLPLLAGVSAHLAVAAGLLWLAYGLARPATGRRGRGPRPWRPLLLDAAGWVLGAALAVAAAGSGWAVAGTLTGGVVGLALLATHADLLRAALARRLGQVLEAQEAGERVLAAGTGSGLAALADRIRRECRVAVPCQWFELAILSGPEAPKTWGGPNGAPLALGAAEPPPAPPPLPGVHRRPRWRRFERELSGEGGVLARLRLWCDPRQVEPGAEALLDSLLPQLSVSVERALLERAANTDTLTGLASRRVFEDRLAAAFRAAREEGTTLALALFDIDHFKRTNDQHGHAVGDQALIAVAGAVRAGAGGHLTARIGGEEIVVLMVGANGRAGLEVAERVREEVAAIALPAGVQILALTLSAGVAAHPELFARSGEELLELADAALYEAKRQGRNRYLLSRGRGRYQSVDGSAVQALGSDEDDAGPVRAPQFFA